MFSDLSYSDSPPKTTSSRPLASFLRSLYTLVSDPSTDDIVCWNSEGTSFVIHDVQRFAAEILPQYYKHNNFSSFSRQLNFYSFKKVIDEDEEGGYLSIAKPNTFEYRHKYFMRGRPDLLFRVVRKTNATAIKELAAEEKADRLKRKRGEAFMAQLSLAASLLSPSGAPAVPPALGSSLPHGPPPPAAPTAMARASAPGADPSSGANPLASPVTSLAALLSQTLNHDSDAAEADCGMRRRQDSLAMLSALLSPPASMAYGGHGGSASMPLEANTARPAAGSFGGPPPPVQASAPPRPIVASLTPLASPAAMSGASAGAAAAEARLRSAGLAPSTLPAPTAIISPSTSWSTAPDSGAAAAPTRPPVPALLPTSTVMPTVVASQAPAGAAQCAPPVPNVDCLSPNISGFCALDPGQNRIDSDDSITVRDVHTGAEVQAASTGRDGRSAVRAETRNELSQLADTSRMLDDATQGLTQTLQSLIASGASKFAIGTSTPAAPAASDDLCVPCAALLPVLAEQQGGQTSTTGSSDGAAATCAPSTASGTAVAAERGTSAHPQVVGPAISAKLAEVPAQLRVAMFLQLLLSQNMAASIPAGPLGNIPVSSVIQLAQRMQLPVMNVLTALLQLQDGGRSDGTLPPSFFTFENLDSRAAENESAVESSDSDDSSNQRKTSYVIRTRRGAAMEARARSTTASGARSRGGPAEGTDPMSRGRSWTAEGSQEEYEEHPASMGHRKKPRRAAEASARYESEHGILSADDATAASLKRRWRPQQLETAAESPLGSAVRSIMTSQTLSSYGYQMSHASTGTTSTRGTDGLSTGMAPTSAQTSGAQPPAIDTSIPAVAASLLSLGREATTSHYALLAQQAVNLTDGAAMAPVNDAEAPRPPAAGLADVDADMLESALRALQPNAGASRPAGQHFDHPNSTRAAMPSATWWESLASPPAFAAAGFSQLTPLARLAGSFSTSTNPAAAASTSGLPSGEAANSLLSGLDLSGANLEALQSLMSAGLEAGFSPKLLGSVMSPAGMGLLTPFMGPMGAGNSTPGGSAAAGMSGRAAAGGNRLRKAARPLWAHPSSGGSMPTGLTTEGPRSTATSTTTSSQQH